MPPRLFFVVVLLAASTLGCGSTWAPDDRPAVLTAASGEVALVAVQDGQQVRARRVDRDGAPTGAVLSLWASASIRALVTRPVGGWIAVLETAPRGDAVFLWLALDGSLEAATEIARADLDGVSLAAASVLGDRVVLGPSLAAPGVIAIARAGTLDRATDLSPAGIFVASGERRYLVHVRYASATVQPVDARGEPLANARTHSFTDFVLPPVDADPNASSAVAVAGEDVVVAAVRGVHTLGLTTMVARLRADGTTEYLPTVMRSRNVALLCTTSAIEARALEEPAVSGVANGDGLSIFAWLPDGVLGRQEVLVSARPRGQTGATGLALTR